MQPNLGTTNLLLGIMAAVSVLEALLIIGMGIAGWMVYRRVMDLVTGLEERQIAPLMVRVNAILGDVKDVTAKVKEETERVDQAIRTTMDRVDDTADRVRSNCERRPVVSSVSSVGCGSPSKASCIRGRSRRRVRKAESNSNRRTPMADGHDQYDNEGAGGGSFVMGLLTGTVLGAGLGMLFAPKAGSELRNQLSDQAGTLANTASEGYRRASESAGEWADRGREMYDKARDAVASGADEAQKYVRDTAGSFGGSQGSSSGSGSPGSMGSSGATGSGSSYQSGSSTGGSSTSGRGSGSDSHTSSGGSHSTGSGSSSGGSSSGGGSHSGGSSGSSGSRRS